MEELTTGFQGGIGVISFGVLFVFIGRSKGKRWGSLRGEERLGVFFRFFLVGFYERGEGGER